MGLDMYLYSFEAKNRKKILNYEKLPSNEQWGLFEEMEVLADWRKANMLHNFFCTYGEECLEEILYIIPRTLISEFIIKASVIITKKDKALSAKALPTCSGFFYGSVEYDDDYYLTVCEAIKTLADILNKNPDDEFVYYASW